MRVRAKWIAPFEHTVTAEAPLQERSELAQLHSSELPVPGLPEQEFQALLGQRAEREQELQLLSPAQEFRSEPAVPPG